MTIKSFSLLELEKELKLTRLKVELQNQVLGLVIAHPPSLPILLDLIQNLTFNSPSLSPSLSPSDFHELSCPTQPSLVNPKKRKTLDLPLLTSLASSFSLSSVINSDIVNSERINSDVAGSETFQSEYLNSTLMDLDPIPILTFPSLSYLPIRKQCILTMTSNALLLTSSKPPNELLECIPTSQLTYLIILPTPDRTEKHWSFLLGYNSKAPFTTTSTINTSTSTSFSASASTSPSLPEKLKETLPFEFHGEVLGWIVPSGNVKPQKKKVSSTKTKTLLNSNQESSPTSNLLSLSGSLLTPNFKKSLTLTNNREFLLSLFQTLFPNLPIHEPNFTVFKGAESKVTRKGIGSSSEMNDYVYGIKAYRKAQEG